MVIDEWSWFNKHDFCTLDATCAWVTFRKYFKICCILYGSGGDSTRKYENVRRIIIKKETRQKKNSENLIKCAQTKFERDSSKQNFHASETLRGEKAKNHEPSSWFNKHDFFKEMHLSSRLTSSKGSCSQRETIRTDCNFVIPPAFPDFPLFDRNSIHIIGSPKIKMCPTLSFG